MPTTVKEKESLTNQISNSKKNRTYQSQENKKKECKNQFQMINYLRRL